MKNKNINMLMVSFLLLGILSIVLMVFLSDAQEKFEEDITVSANGVTEKILSVRELKLVPTDSKKYTVNLLCRASGGYGISLDFIEKADGGMKPFVNVSVKCDGLTVYKGKLSDLLDSAKVIEFDGELKADEPLKITVAYEMPGEVGNEAQGSYADFDIRLKIEKN